MKLSERDCEGFYQDVWLRFCESIIQTYNSNDPAKDFSIQLSKLSHALFSETYVPPLPAQGNGNDSTYEENAKDESLLEKYVIAPRMLKHCVAGTHPEFSSGRQQDVTEYFTYFLDQLNRSERVNLHRLIPGGILDAPSTDSIFNFGLEIKFKDLNSSDVKLINKGPQTLNNLFELPIPLDKAVPKPTANINENSKEDGNEAKRQKIEDPNNDDRMVRLDDCLAKFFEPEVLLMKHPATQEKLPFQRTLKFHTFPRYLVIKLSRYYVTENWTQKKILLEVPMPETLDLNQYRGHGLSPGEKEIIENNNSGSVGAAQAAPVFTIDEELVMNLVSMGFSENGCRRAAIATNNADMETAMNWILEHMEDPDFNAPPVLPSTTGGAADNNGLPEVSEESIQMLTVMGYTEEQCRAALIATNQNIER
jgi:ubiquitin carboxyl-terminal hydrolase 5/13